MSDDRQFSAQPNLCDACGETLIGGECPDPDCDGSDGD